MLPPEWSAEQEEDVIRICVTDQDGIGELAVTALIREQADAAESSRTIQLPGQESPEVTDWVSRRLSVPFRACLGLFRRTGQVVREWYLSHGPVSAPLCAPTSARPRGCWHGRSPRWRRYLGTLVPGDALLDV